jgi:hypothetical protein
LGEPDEGFTRQALIIGGTLDHEASRNRAGITRQWFSADAGSA